MAIQQASVTTAIEYKTGNNGLEQRPRVGQISFANCLPITLPFQRQLVHLDADVCFESPSALNTMFEKEMLDVGAMSSFYYLSRADLELIADISIACTGPVGSVLLFSKQHPSKLNRDSRFIGSAQSATSVNLLKVLFNQHFGFIPDISQDLSPNLSEPHADAALVIGDNALNVDESWTAQYERIDLGQWWVETYGLPMVFGVWAARKAWSQDQKQQFTEVAARHVEAKQIGLSGAFPQVIQEAKRRTGLSEERLADYYRKELDFRLTEQHIQGLNKYRQECVRLGLL